MSRRCGLLRLLLLLTLCLIVRPSASQTCPSGCLCTQEQDGQSARCKGGSLSSILGTLTSEFSSVSLSNTANAQVLHPSQFQEISNIPLKRLVIERSWMNEIQPGAFETLATLEELGLGHNMLTTLPAGAFQGLPNLKILNLSGNRINKLNNALKSLFGLKKLDLSFNLLKDLNTGLFRSQHNLESLILDGNSLHNLHGYVFQGLQNLKVLSLRNCNLMLISNGMFGILRSLVTLDLGHNHITELPVSQEFRNLPLLRFLHLDNNEITFLRDAQFSGITLDTLQLSRNGIRSISSNAFKYFNVRYLDLSFNAITRLQDNFVKSTAPQLEKLNFAGNHVSTLESNAFEGLYRLQALNLSSCTIDKLHHRQFTSLKNIKTLDISRNNLREASESILTMFDQLKSLKLSENSWNCDCEIKVLRDWLQHTKSSMILKCDEGGVRKESCSMVRCSSPPNLANTPIVSLQDHDIDVCHKFSDNDQLPPGVEAAIVCSCLLIGIALVVVTVILWRRGRTKHHLQRACIHPPTESSHFDVEPKPKLFPGCDITSLAESDKSYVFKNYFQTMSANPSNPLTPSLCQPSIASQRDIDSVYSSQPSLYSASSITCPIHVSRESTV